MSRDSLRGFVHLGLLATLLQSFPNINRREFRAGLSRLKQTGAFILATVQTEAFRRHFFNNSTNGQARSRGG